jgi:sodium-dependent dicarboxylate transporter 2/3/5
MDPEQSRENARGLLPVWDRYRRWVGWILGPVTGLGLWLWPVPELSVEAHRLLAVWGLVMVLWLTEALPLGATALLAACLCVVLGVGDARTVFRSFGHPVLFLFVGSFLLAAGMMRHGLSRRLAIGLLGLPGVAERPGRLLAAFALACGGLSMWVSNTSTAAMLFPMALAVITEWERRERGAVAGRGSASPVSSLLLVVAFAASIGGMATPVGSPPNLIGLAFLREQAGVELSFFQWMVVALPVAAGLGGFLVGYFSRVCRGWAGESRAGTAWVEELRKGLGPWTRAEKQVLAAFLATVVLWVFPGLVSLLAGTDAALYRWWTRHLPEEVCALLGALVLFALPVDWRRGEFALGWEEIRRVDWGTILLFGGGLALGEAAVATGLAPWLGRKLVEMLPAGNTFALTLLFTVMAVLLTEVTSNTATANVVVPMALAAAQAAGVTPVAPAMGACLGASLAFMLPVSTPPNALVYGSGRVRLGTMLRHGLMLDVVGIVLVVMVTVWWLPWVLRWVG